MKVGRISRCSFEQGNKFAVTDERGQKPEIVLGDEIYGY